MVGRQHHRPYQPPSSMDCATYNIEDQSVADNGDFTREGFGNNVVELSAWMSDAFCVATGQQYSSPPSHNTSFQAPYAQQSANATNSFVRPSYATVARRGTKESIQTVKPSPPSSTIVNIQQRQQKPDYLAAETDYNRLQVQQNEDTSCARPPTYAQVLRSPPPTQHVANINQIPSASPSAQEQYTSEQSAEQWSAEMAWTNLFFDEAAQIGPVDESALMLPNVNPNVIGDDMTNNFNWQSGITEPFLGVDDWVGQPRATGDRTRPRLDTSNHHLAPNPQSPLSTSSPSSSRVSTRRNRAQLLFGKHRCNICLVAFDTVADLNHHSLSHAPYEERPHYCDICGRRFRYPKDLQRHSVVHNPGSRSHLCKFPNCNRNYKRPDHLERHYRSQHAVDSVQQISHPPSQHEA